MRNGFGIAYMITAFGLLIVMAFVIKSKDKLWKSIFMVLLTCLFSLIFNTTLLYVDDVKEATNLLTLYSATMSWTIFFNFQFLCDYTEQKAFKDRFSWLFMDLSIFDSIFILLNFKTGFVLGARRASLYCFVFYRMVPYFYYYIHLMISYLVVFVCMLMLINAARKASSFYRFKYLIVIVAELFIVVANGIYIITGSVSDFSVMAYAISGGVIAYTAIKYVPLELLKRTLSRFVQDSNEALIAFDADGYVIYRNNLAKENADSYSRVLNNIIPLTEDGRLPFNTIKDFSIKKTVMDNDEHRVIQVEHKRLMDKGEQFLGNYFTVRDITSQEESIKAEHYAATHDLLTGLYNKDRFINRVEELLYADPDTKRVMICSNVDEFKMINDIFGLKIGDDILIQIADVIKNIAPPGSIFARVGSDRFAMLMSKKDFDDGRILAGMGQPIVNKANESYPLSVKVGVYEIEDPSMHPSLMIDRCFLATASIKGDFNTRIAYYNESLRNSIVKERNLSGDLDKALTNKEFMVYLQPQVNGTGEILGAEALVRWKHKNDDGTETYIMPGDFISVYESNGLISKLDVYIWDDVCKLLRKWKDMGREDYYISVNISPKDFFFLKIYDVFESLVNKYGISKKCLKLEITETAIMTNPEQQLGVVHKLREAGFIVEMDDFGNGYSSLTMLKNMDVDVIKLDVNFLRGEGDEVKTKTILKMVVELTKSLGSEVIAEGVETKEHVDYLRSVGCDVFQGYYFAKPMPVSEFEEKYFGLS